ncbi:MAG: hypothetical protein BGO09_08230 [Bacteroidetes bacterium 47-18]|nr:MAG: hypothetical protein BGO09_08230 [Bacteroidetes bacterium 47-18]
MKKNFIIILLLLVSSYAAPAQFQVSFGTTNLNCNEVRFDIYCHYPGGNPAMQGGVFVADFGDGTLYTLTPQINGTNSTAYLAYVHTFADAGPHLVHIGFISGGMSHDAATQIVHPGCAYYSGKLYLRGDNNCYFNSGVDIPVQFPYGIQVSEDNTILDTIRSLDRYSYYLDALNPAANYKLKIIGYPAYYQVVCPPNGEYAIPAGTPGEQYRNLDFFLEAAPGVNSYDAYIYACGYFRSPYTSYLTLSYGNKTMAELDGKVTLHIDSNYRFASSLPAPAYVSLNNDTVSWDVDSLTASASESILVELESRNLVAPGTVACNTAFITDANGSVTADLFPADNSYTFCDSVRSSFDPNAKYVQPSGNLLTDTTLMTYTIEFENLGNDTAFNVYIVDTLSQYLDISTLQVLFATHDFQVNQRHFNGQTVLRFDFPDILLPDSSSEYNKGHIIYRIRTKDNLPIGTRIENTAYICFDSNAAVVTNTVVNERVSNTVGIPGAAGMELSKTIQLYPNPAHTELNVWFQTASVKEFYVADMTGKALAHYKVNSPLVKVDLSRFARGSYVLIVYDKGKLYSTKVFVKQ